MTRTALDDLAVPPCSRLLGWRVLEARPADGVIRIRFDGRAEFCNPAGFIQGGILAAMLDDTMGPTVFIRTDGRLYTATIATTVNYLAPARVGVIIGEGRVAQLGKSVAFVEAALTDEAGTRLATATSVARPVESKAIR